MTGKLGIPGGRCKPPFPKMIWKHRRGAMDLTRQGRVMGILNVTPDSFSDGGSYFAIGTALKHARRMIEEGAELIDIGGESTRPGAVEVPEDEEIARTIPVVSALRNEWDGVISIDTSKASVASAAISAGADVVNDVSGLTADERMIKVCADSGVGVVVMHMQGIPRTMQVAPVYMDVVEEVRAFFRERFVTLTASGIAAEALCFDPGIGFGKNPVHNLTLLRSLDAITVENRPILLGVSRKSFIARVIGTPDVEHREWPTVAITSNAREQGAMIFRVHSVRPNLEAMRMIEAILAR